MEKQGWIHGNLNRLGGSWAVLFEASYVLDVRNMDSHSGTKTDRRGTLCSFRQMYPKMRLKPQEWVFSKKNLSPLNAKKLTNRRTDGPPVYCYVETSVRDLKACRKFCNANLCF